MEKAGDFLRSLSDSMECPICYLIFDKPTSLPCGHTFCCDCIQSYCDGLDVGIAVLCPVCKQPFHSPVTNLPVNFVVQNLIDDSLRSREWLCQACLCGDDRKIELATTRCQDCLKSLCDSCSTQLTHAKHCLRSLIEKKCDIHHQNLVLHCIGCRANICAVCFSEHHQSHTCDAISKVAERLTQTLKSDVDELRACRSRLETVLANLTAIVSQNTKYQKHFLDGMATKTKMATTRVNPQCNISNETIDYILGILDSVILQRSSQAERLQKLLSDVEKLTTRANDVIHVCSLSAYNATEKATTIHRIDEEIKSLLHRCTEEENSHVASSSTEDETVLTLQLEELLKYVATLGDDNQGRQQEENYDDSHQQQQQLDDKAQQQTQLNQDVLPPDRPAVLSTSEVQQPQQVSVLRNLSLNKARISATTELRGRSLLQPAQNQADGSNLEQMNVSVNRPSRPTCTTGQLEVRRVGPPVAPRRRQSLQQQPRQQVPVLPSSVMAELRGQITQRSSHNQPD